MSGVAITSLSLADALDGTEVFPIIQGGSTKKSTTELLITYAATNVSAATETRISDLSALVSLNEQAVASVSAELSVLTILVNAVGVTAITERLDTVSVAISVLTVTKVSVSDATIWNPTITNYVETAYTPVSVSSYAVSLDRGTIHQIYTIGANTCVSLPEVINGKSFVVIVYYGGAHAITWTGGTTIKWPGGIAPTASSSATAADIFTFFQDTSATYGNLAGRDF